MVILGGLEFVAAGYVLKELSKGDKEAEKKKQRRDSRDRRDRKDRKHHQRRDSPPRQSRPPQQMLAPPQAGPHRPYSAPPPGSRPMFNPQPVQGHQQQWQPQPVAYYPPQQHPVQQYPVAPRPHPPPTSVPPPQMNPSYPPPGTYIDMKTGKIQNNLYPPEMNPFGGQSRGVDHDRLRSESDYYPNGSGSQPHVYVSPEQNLSQPQLHTQRVPSPLPGYAELDSETFGRVRSYDEKRDSPHVRIAVPGQDGNVWRPGRDSILYSPPPSYRE